MQYSILGEPMPVVICNVDAGETLITERGSMSWMTPNMRMETSTNGGLGKAFGRIFTGEAMFQNKYTALGGPGQIAFASSFPGSIRAIEVGNGGPNYIVQKGGFLAGTRAVFLISTVTLRPRILTFGKYSSSILRYVGVSNKCSISSSSK